LWTVTVGQAELFAMVSDEWSSTVNPVLVLSCVPDSDSSRLSCMDVVRSLQLQKLTRPWQVCTKFLSGDVDSFERFSSARITHYKLLT